jgi:hypothetical protein
MQVAGAAWRAMTRIMSGVGDLMQRIEDGRTGHVLDGPTIERLGDTLCGLHRARGDKEHRFLGLASKPLGWFISGLTSKPLGQFINGWTSKTLRRFVTGLALKPLGWFISGLASKPLGRFVSGLTSKPLGRFLPVWPQNRWRRFLSV